MPAGGDVRLAALLVGGHEHIGGDLRHPGGVVDDAGGLVALDVVDVGLVEGPGVDLALGAAVRRVDRPVVEAERLGRTVEIATVEPGLLGRGEKSEEHTSELQSLMRISYAVFCLKKKN